jgi:DNA-binding NarL/FixJ family response regulator
MTLRPSPAGLRAVIAEPYDIVRDGVRSALVSAGIAVVGETFDPVAGATLCERRRPHTFVTDLAPNRDAALDAIRRMHRSHPTCAIVVLADRLDAECVADARKAGARGFVLHQSARDVLVAAVRECATGGDYVDPVLAVGLLDAERELLSPRERHVLQLLAAGHSTITASEELALSPETVKTHVKRIMLKLGVETRTHAVAIALRDGYIAYPSERRAA